MLADLENNETAHILALIAIGVCVHYKNSYGESCLHIALAEGLTDIALALIAAGADVNGKNRKGYSCLYVALTKGFTDIALALIAAGADVNAKYKYGASDDPITPWDRSCFHVAMTKGLADVALALIAEGANVNIQDNCGCTSLHYFRCSNTALFQTLLSKGVNPYTRDHSGYNAFHSAVWTGNVEVVLMFIMNGIDIDTPHIDGGTGLHIASGKGDIDTVQCLLAGGANPYLKNWHDQTPLDLATNKEVRELLRKALLDKSKIGRAHV